MPPKIPLVLQCHDFDCSRACALMVAPGIKPPRPRRDKGLKPEQFVKWAQENNIYVNSGFELDLQLGSICLIMYGPNTHYVVYVGSTSKYLKFNDPERGKIRLSPSRFRKIWTGWSMLCRM